MGTSILFPSSFPHISATTRLPLRRVLPPPSAMRLCECLGAFLEVSFAGDGGLTFLFLLECTLFYLYFVIAYPDSTPCEPSYPLWRSATNAATTTTVKTETYRYIDEYIRGYGPKRWKMTKGTGMRIFRTDRKHVLSGPVKIGN